MKIEEQFQRIAERAATVIGSWWSFGLGILIACSYAMDKPWPERGDLITNLIMFFMLFLAQSGQNRQGRAIQLKLDELILCIKEADNKFAGIEKKSDEVLTEVEKEIESYKEK